MHISLDHFWQQAHEALLRHVPSGHSLLLPVGDWPPLPFSVSTYDSHGKIARPAGITGVLVHKGLLGAFAQRDTAALLARGVPAFANEVFVLFVARSTVIDVYDPVHVVPLEIYAHPARFRRVPAKRGAFLHIPKTGGTSVWARISQGVRSAIYFASDVSLAMFEGDINAFEAIGGHFSAATLLAKGWDGPVICVVREPVARITSFFAHARRDGENMAMLDGNFHVARRVARGDVDPGLQDMLFYQFTLQVRLLGADADDDLTRPEILARALARATERLNQPGWTCALSDAGSGLDTIVARQFNIDRSPLQRLNTTAPGDRTNNARITTILREFMREHPDACADQILHARALARSRRR